MADGLTTQSSTLATIPSASKIATDDCGSPGHVQLVKLAISTDGDATLLTADNTDGMLVKVTNASALRTPGVTSQVQSSAGLTTATTNYTAGDVLGTGWVFTSMGSSGTIRGITFIDKADVLSAVSGVVFYFFSGAVTFGTDNAAPALSDSDAEKFLFSQSNASPEDNGSAGLSSYETSGFPYVCDSTSLYVYARSVSNHNFFAAATDIVLRLFYDTPA